MAKTMGMADKRPRGRPRAYDRETALQRARDVFWQTGYAGSSLDQISAATGMNRPSLKAAFGDKRALYLAALEAYWEFKALAMGKALDAGTPEEALLRVYEMSLDTYFSGVGGTRGCFVVGTAITEAAEDPEIRRIVTEGFRMLDESFEGMLRSSRERGQLSAASDTAALASLASATLHSMAVRARAGATREELWALACQAVKVICGSV